MEDKIKDLIEEHKILTFLCAKESAIFENKPTENLTPAEINDQINQGIQFRALILAEEQIRIRLGNYGVQYNNGKYIQVTQTEIDTPASADVEQEHDHSSEVMDADNNGRE